MKVENQKCIQMKRSIVIYLIVLYLIKSVALYSGETKYFHMNVQDESYIKDNNGAKGKMALSIGIAESYGDQSIAIGTIDRYNKITKAIGRGAIAIGSGAIAGQNIEDFKEAEVGGSIYNAFKDADFYPEDNYNSIAIGTNSESLYRRSTAINGKTKSADSVAINGFAYGLGANIGILGAVTGDKAYNSIAMLSTTDKKESIVLGRNSGAYENNSTAIGTGAIVSVENGAAIGAYSESYSGKSVGYDPLIGGIFDIESYVSKDMIEKEKEKDINYEISILDNNPFKAKRSVWESDLGALSVGSGLENRQIINVSAGTHDSDAVNVAQLKSLEKIAKDKPIVYVSTDDEKRTPLFKGKDGKYYPVGSLYYNGKYYKPGVELVSYFDSEDNFLRKVMPNKEEILEGKKFDELIAVLKNSDGNTTKPTRLSNISEGIEDKDAVNVSQLNAVKNEILNGMGNQSDKLAAYSKETNAGLAGVYAASNIPQVIEPCSPYSIGAGVGYYRGETALAVGASASNKNGRFLFKSSASINSKGNVGAGAGVAFTFGGSKEYYDSVKERCNLEMK